MAISTASRPDSRLVKTSLVRLPPESKVTTSSLSESPFKPTHDARSPGIAGRRRPSRRVRHARVRVLNHSHTYMYFSSPRATAPPSRSASSSAPSSSAILRSRRLRGFGLVSAIVVPLSVRRCVARRSTRASRRAKTTERYGVIYPARAYTPPPSSPSSTRVERAWLIFRRGLGPRHVRVRRPRRANRRRRRRRRRRRATAPATTTTRETQSHSTRIRHGVPQQSTTRRAWSDVATTRARRSAVLVTRGVARSYQRHNVFLSSKIHRILASITCTRRARHRSTRRRHHTITHPHGICTYRAHVRETRVLKNHITHHKGLQYTYTTTYDAHVCGVENPGSFRRRGSGDYISRVYSIGFAAAGSSRTCGVAHPRRRPWRGSRASRTRGSRARDGDGVDDVDDDGWHRMASMSTRWRCGEACFSASSS